MHTKNSVLQVINVRYYYSQIETLNIRRISEPPFAMYLKNTK